VRPLYKLFINVSCAAMVVIATMVATPGYADFFSRGSKSVSVIVGSGQAFNENYTILGAGFTYYAFDGLGLGIDFETWTGGTPSINKISPQIQYVFKSRTETRPYLGMFFRKAKIDGQEDLDSVGYRAGVLLTSDADYYLGAGLVFENYQDCSETIFVSCSDTYPEITIAITF